MFMILSFFFPNTYIVVALGFHSKEYEKWSMTKHIVTGSTMRAADAFR